MKSSTLLLIIITLSIIAGAYWYVSIRGADQAPLTATASQSATQTQFQALVSKLGTISFRTTIFSDPKFSSLVDLTTPITPEASGRSDPFAPVPGVAVN